MVAAVCLASRNRGASQTANPALACVGPARPQPHVPQWYARSRCPSPGGWQLALPATPIGRGTSTTTQVVEERCRMSNIKSYRRICGEWVWELGEYRLDLRPLAAHFAVMLLTPFALVTAVTRPPGRSPLARAIQVRLDDELLRRLTSIADHANALGYGELTRSSMIREAVVAYAKPLIALLDRTGRLDEEHDAQLAGEPETSNNSFSETTRVRLNEDLVEQLNRIEAYARGLGYRHATRSSLIRNALSAYLSGLDSELARADLGESGDPYPLLNSSRQ
jgi:predicted transcriptional regulator